MRQTTIRDVARHAGVSATAVSRYLNSQLVLPPETVRRIEAAVHELRYVPNAIARRLSRRRSETFGFVTADVVYPFFAAIASAAEQAAFERGYSLTIFNSRNDPAKELQFLSRIDDRQVDGMLLMTNHVDDGQLREKINSSRNIVLIDEDVPGAIAPRLFAENRKGGLLAIRHLIAHGHERIAYVGGPHGLISVDERYEGYCEAMREAGISVDPLLVQCSHYYTEVAENNFHTLWDQQEPPTAIFAGGDLLALGIMRAARKRGLRIPHDFSLVSFDDMPNADLYQPPLTTIRQSAEEFGRRGVEMLLQMLDGKVDATPPRIQVSLIERESVGPPRASALRRIARPERKRSAQS